VTPPIPPSRKINMAATKRLMKERASLAKEPIPYITFQDDDDDDEAMSDQAGINEWRFIITLDPKHDGLDKPDDIGAAADSPYCSPPRSPSKKSGLVSAVARATKSSKRSSNGDVKTMGGTAYFAFQLDFPVNYPFKAPKITVLSNSYHPNINTNTGEICDNLLTGEGWSPTINVRKICARLRRFLCVPDPDHPLESAIAQTLVEKPTDYAEKAFKYAGEECTLEKAHTAMKTGKSGKKSTAASK